MKKKVLQHAAKVWRDFKNKLVLKHIKTTSKDGPPYEIYNFISFDDWKEFERRCTSSPFKVCLLFFLHVCSYLTIFEYLLTFSSIFYFSILGKK